MKEAPLQKLKKALNSKPEDYMGSHKDFKSKALKKLKRANTKHLKEDYDSRGYHKETHEHRFSDFGAGTKGYKPGY